MTLENYRKWGIVNWLWSWWVPTSYCMLRQTEKKMLSCLKSQYHGCFVDIGPVIGKSDKIWTISLNEHAKKIPLVLYHGLGSGVALWCLNLDAFARDRPVYALDLPGFGRSSRPVFSENSLKAEEQFIASLEEWRKEMNIDKMIILGHNMGGFLAIVYAIKYPNRVAHLILADLWGFQEKPIQIKQKSLFGKLLSYVWSPPNPLFAVRAAGPFGDWLIRKAKPDFVKRFTPALNNDSKIVSQYIYQCNCQPPTGEAAFQTMALDTGWANNPLLFRIDNLHKDIHVTLLYGSRSWIDYSAGEKIKEKRPDSYVKIQVISGAGNHLYADKSDLFNRYVTEACNYSDPV